MSIDERLNKLRILTENYNKLPDDKKIQQVDMYNEIISEKDKCSAEVELCRTVLCQTSTYENVTCTDDDFNKMMESIKIIETQMSDPNISFDMLRVLLKQFGEYKAMFEVYAKDRKMKMVNL
jgi:uncharacterized protein YneF (UPF0154 family)